MRHGRHHDVAIAPLLVPMFLLLGEPARAADADLGTPITTTAEIETLMTGNTLDGVFEETGEFWVEYYCESGKSLYDFRNRISLGKWWVENAQVCFSYDWSNYQHAQCFALYQRKDRALSLVAVDKDGARLMTFRSNQPVPGDPYHLEERAPHGCRPEPSV